MDAVRASSDRGVARALDRLSEWLEPWLGATIAESAVHGVCAAAVLLYSHGSPLMFIIEADDSSCKRSVAVALYSHIPAFSAFTMAQDSTQQIYASL